MKAILWTSILILLCSSVYAALSDNIVSYYKFDTDNAIQPDSVSSNHLTVTSATYNTSGKINNAYDYDNTNDYMTNAAVSDFEMSTFTASFWYYAETTDGLGYLLSFGNGFSSPYHGWHIMCSGDNKINLFTGKSGGYHNIFTTGTYNANAWNHIAITFSGTVAKIYINDNAEETFSDLGAVLYHADNRIFKVGFLSIGTDDRFYIDGIIDEIGVWSRVLSAAEIAELFNSGSPGSAQQYPFSDTDSQAPEVNLTDPSDINTTVTTRNWTYVNITANESLNGCLLEWNTSANHTMTQGASDTTFYYNQTNNIDANFTYKVFCNDTSDNEGISADAWVEFAVPPVISLVSPSDINTSVTTKSWTYVNISSNEALNGCLLEWNTSNNYTMTQGASDTTFYYNQTGNANENYTYRVICNDTSDNEGNSSTAWVQFHFKSGLVSTTPGATPFYTNKSSNPYTIYLEGDGDWEVVTFWVNATGPIDSSHEFYVFANQTTNLSINNETKKFDVNITTAAVDTQDPEVNLTSPSDINTTISTRNWTYVNITANESLNGCLLEWNTSANHTMTQGASDTTFYYNQTNNIDANYTYRVLCNDTSDNEGISSSAWVEFAVPPVISLVAPSDINTSITTRNWTYVNISSNEALNGCLLEWNTSANHTMTQGASDTTFYYNQSNNINANFTYRVLCNDTSDNEGISSSAWVEFAVSPDTCSCPSGEDWVVTCSDDCSITSNCDITGYSLHINGGGGYFELLANITADMVAVDPNCEFRNEPDDGNWLMIKGG